MGIPFFLFIKSSEKLLTKLFISNQTPLEFSRGLIKGRIAEVVFERVNQITTSHIFNSPHLSNSKAGKFAKFKYKDYTLM